MASRIYVVKGENVTLANQAVTLVIINPGTSTTPAIKILRAWVGQSGSTTSAQQRVLLGTKASVFGTYVSATPQKIITSDPVSGITGGTAGAAGTCGINASAEGAGTLTAIVQDAFNVLTGWQWVATPNDALEFSTASGLAFVMHFPAAASSLTGWSFGVTYQELG